MEENQLDVTLLLDSVKTSYVSININQFRVPGPIFVLGNTKWKPGKCFETEITISGYSGKTPETITILYSNEEKKIEMTYRVLSVKEVQEFKTTYKVEPI